MGFFGLFGKKKETSGCTSCAGCAMAGKCSSSAKEPVTSVKVLGAGCKFCKMMFEGAQLAVKELGLDIEVEYVTDMEKVTSYGIMSMPGLVVNEKVVSAGKVLSSEDIKKLIQ